MLSAAHQNSTNPPARDIKRSLNKRARMRRAYFKMIGEDPKKAMLEKKAQSIDKEIDLSDASDSENEENVPASQPKTAEGKPKTAEAKPKKPRGKQIASQKRSEKYHQQKEAEERLRKNKARREQNKTVMQKRTAKGQPRLGAQMGVLLDKIKKS